MADFYTWEESFDSDRATFARNGECIGYVEPLGASWVVVFHGKEVAFRPDKASASYALSKLVVESSKAKSETPNPDQSKTE